MIALNIIYLIYNFMQIANIFDILLNIVLDIQIIDILSFICR